MKRLPTIHRMDRRSTFKNYMLPGIYHVTVKATETLRSPFGVVVGSIDKPDGDADAHLGQVIAGFKLGCNHHWWRMTGQQLMRPAAAEEAAGSPAAEAPGTGAGRFRRQGAHHIATLPSLFQEGYCDVMPVDADAPSQFSAERFALMEGRLLREKGGERPGGGTAGNMIACDTYGDRRLLERRMLPVVCAEGRLLIVTPWAYHYRRSDEGISLMECKTMNCLAQAICRLRDDWWKQEGTKN